LNANGEYIAAPPQYPAILKYGKSNLDEHISMKQNMQDSYGIVMKSDGFYQSLFN
jgi:hypothetical protein